MSPVNSSYRVLLRGLIVLGVAARPDLGGAQCTYGSLASGTGTTVTVTPQHFRFNQSAPYWSAVAVRSSAGDNWDVAVFRNSAGAPACVENLLGQSNRTTGVDFVIGDFNPGSNAPGTYYPRALRISGGGNAAIEWDDGPDLLTVNAPLVTRTTGASDVIETWDVYLSANDTYSFRLVPSGADLRLLVFQNPTGGPFWAGRDGAVLELASGSMSYTPLISGFYGVVVINESGAAGSYSLGVGTCVSPTALTAEVVETTQRAENYYSFRQPTTFWAAVGVRGSSNWQLDAYSAPGTTPFPTCFDKFLATSRVPPSRSDVIVGNFNTQLLGVYYVRAYLDQGLGSGTATVEWDSGGRTLVVDGGRLTRTTGSGDVVGVWDVYLEAGMRYGIDFRPTGADLKMLLFRDTGEAWFGRTEAVLEAAGGATYTAPGEGFYGVVVVNDNGATGSFELGVSRGGLLAADPEPTLLTRLEGVQPNPSTGAAQVRFTLREPATVSFEVLDVAGRVVARTPPRRWAAGRWRAGWGTADLHGPEFGPGIYFVRMLLAGRSLGTHRFTVLK